ncbi:MAG: FAD-dependent oxidoreductase [Eubacterium sp.]|nr:FAD-dependent oxidoreductase [Eubacterium sp.]
MIKIDSIILPVGAGREELNNKISRMLKGREYEFVKILRQSLDARKKNDIHYNYSVLVKMSDNEAKLVKMINNKNITLTNPVKYQFPFSLDSNKRENSLNRRPVIIGSGPAGYFAATVLADNGFCPIVIERGCPVEERKADVETFWETGKLNVESNVSFGEGGAGTFSDGKLNTGNKDRDGIYSFVFETFRRFGAHESVCYDAKPHIGTDVLMDVMKNMRNNILSKGGNILFNTKLIDIIAEENDVYKLKLESKLTYDQLQSSIENLSGQDNYVEIVTDNIILATGHSSRDTMKMLYDRGFSMEQKPFAVGLRIEHPRKMIDDDRYGEALSGKLPAADYKLTYHAGNGRAVFSFCMCPGGYVINASSEEGCMTVNGMSYSGRDSDNSNSAIVVNINPDDIKGDAPLDAVKFQVELEKAFYNAGQGNVPVQLFGDFVKGEKSEKLGSIKPMIKGKISLAELKSCLPEYLSDAIIEGIRFFGTRIKGFDSEDAVLSGIESRTSSPVRIVRNDDLQAANFPGIFPCGEGAGYAGGITSAAADGIRCAAKLAERIINRS